MVEVGFCWLIGSLLSRVPGGHSEPANCGMVLLYATPRFCIEFCMVVLGIALECDKSYNRCLPWDVFCPGNCAIGR